ncbi:glycosyl transferase, partial [Streptococcus pneumoniae]|nr:glycosyl transferase [Streptococcus pneumoniae]
VYNQELLKYIRENAFAYFHGHEVGGTNPSLLEALASTKLNLLLDVGFNREVAEDGADYWEKDNLHKVIEASEQKTQEEINEKNI